MFPFFAIGEFYHNEKSLRVANKGSSGPKSARPRRDLRGTAKTKMGVGENGVRLWASTIDVAVTVGATADHEKLRILSCAVWNEIMIGAG